MSVSVLYRPLLILLWAVAVVPVDLICVMTTMMGIGIGWNIPNRSNWPQYLLGLSLPILAAIASTALAWLSVRFWNVPKWRRAAFPMAFSYYAVLGLIVWALVVKHWIQ